jgi:transposase-like protein
LNLLAFQAKFPDEAACENHLIQVRWPEGFICGHCQSKAAWYIQSRRTFQCKQCRRQESITANTMFHRSRTALQEWFLAIYLVCESKKGISGLALARHLGMKDERRAYTLKGHIQNAMTERNNRYLLEGFVEVDEAFFGGKTHGQGTGSVGKTAVLVAVSVNEQDTPDFVRFKVIDNTKGETVEAAAKTLIAASCHVVTDGHTSHNHFSEIFQEHIPCPLEKPEQSREYLPWVHILISNAKRFILGTHHSVQHLQNYLEEFSWRFNRRFGNLFDRMLVSALNYRPAYGLA